MCLYSACTRASIDISHQDDSQVFIFVAFRCQHFWGLVEVQIAATVATASYRNFSVATILGRAACLLSVFSQNFNQIHSLLDQSWLGLMSRNLKLWKYTEMMDFSSGFSEKRGGYWMNEGDWRWTDPSQSSSASFTMRCFPTAGLFLLSWWYWTTQPWSSIRCMACSTAKAQNLASERCVLLACSKLNRKTLDHRPKMTQVSHVASMFLSKILAKSLRKVLSSGQITGSAPASGLHQNTTYLYLLVKLAPFWTHSASSCWQY